MQQNILSQVPGSGSQQDVPGSRSGNNSRDPDTGQSRFDDVSRAEQQRLEQKRLEQKRLEQKQADQRAEADRVQEKRAEQRTEEADNRRTDEARHDRKADKAGSDKASEKSAAAEKAKAPDADGKASETKETDDKVASSDVEPRKTTGETDVTEETPDVAMPPVTFAMLQTMTGAAGKTSGSENAVAVNSQMTGSSALQGLLNGQSGQPGQTAGKVLPPGAQLTDLLSANVGGDTARPIDPANLLSAPRFQTALDQAAQQSLQPGNLQAGKLAPENAIPLRSYATSVDVPVGQAEWGDKVMGKLSFLTARNMQAAEIHLTPPDMGPMEVKVRMQNEQANITVHAANPVVREQLEQNSHRLRDMLGEQGVELGQFDVSSQSEQQASEQGDDTGESGAGQGGNTFARGEADDEEAPTAQLDLSWKGEVDLFA